MFFRSSVHPFSPPLSNDSDPVIPPRPLNSGPNRPGGELHVGLRRTKDGMRHPSFTSPVHCFHPLPPMGPEDDTLTFEVVRTREKRHSHIRINFFPLINHMNMPMSRAM